MSKKSSGRRFKTRSSFDQEIFSLDKLHKAEELFAKLAVRLLLHDTSESSLVCINSRGITCTPNKHGISSSIVNSPGGIL